ncbi:DUF262 domain-containing protein [Lysinibacillus capsici]|uniref:DUF262 domain-containing protein n=1 Tax=Lysinibacillus capsici TaxID=2115968 RepID=UPI003F282451
MDLIEEQLLENSTELETDGTEPESIEEWESDETPFDADKIRIEQRMLSLKFMKELIDEDLMNLSPDFQRNRVWNEPRRKSLLIESLMLRIPIPAFYFYEDEDSILHVIDGLQRLHTINDFLNGKFKLKHLQYLHESCDNKTFKELENKHKQRIFMTQFSVNIIDARTPSQVKYDLFRRINTGGVSLNAQEIRNSIAKHSVRNFLKRLANSTEFKIATDNGVKDDRMGAQELVLRYVAFYIAYDFKTRALDYNKSDLEIFLDNAFEKLNKMDEIELSKFETCFKKAMKNAQILFGKKSFRKYNRININGKKKLINKSLFTSLSVILSYIDSELLKSISDKNLAFDKLVDLITENTQFSDCLTVGTNSVKNVLYNFCQTRILIEEILKDVE